MDTYAEFSPLTESDGRDKFIPVRKEELFSALIKQGDLADTAERELFWRFARTLRTICHYEYSETLDRLRDDYYYFSPEVAGLVAADRAKSNSGTSGHGSYGLIAEILRSRESSPPQTANSSGPGCFWLGRKIGR